MSFSSFLIAISWAYTAIYSVRQARQLHSDLVNALVKAPINPFHNRTTKGSILNRLQSDLHIVDNYSLEELGNLNCYTVAFMGTVFMSGYIMPMSLAFFPVVLTFGLILLKMFLPANREATRLLTTVRSPLITLVSETIKGVANVRAFQIANMLKKRMFQRLDNFFLVNQFMFGTQLWFTLYLDFCSWFLIFSCLPL